MAHEEYKQAMKEALPHLQTQAVVDFLEMEQLTLQAGCKEALMSTGEAGLVQRAEMVGRLNQLEELLVLATAPKQS